MGRMKWFFGLQAVSTFFNNIHTLILPFWFYELTGSKLQAGLVFTIAALATLIALPITGVLVDRLRYKPLMLCVELGRAAAMCALALIPHPSLSLVCGIAAFSSVSAALFGSLQQAIIKQNVPSEAMMRAQALLSAMQGASLILAPSAGAVLAQAYGYGLLFFLNGLSFAVGAIGAFCFKDHEPPRTKWTYADDIGLALRTAISTGPVKRSLFLNTTTAFTTSALPVLYVFYFKAIGAELQGLALLMGAQGLGILVGSYFVPRIAMGRRSTLVFALLVGVALCAVALPGHNLISLSCLLVVIGFMHVGVGITARSDIQLATGPTMIGRISALFVLMSVAAGFLSMTLMTVTSGTLSSAGQVLGFGVIQICLTVAWIAADSRAAASVARA